MSSAGFVPFVRITLPFAAGIWLFEKLGFVQPLWWLWVLAALLLVLMTLLLFKVIPMPPYRLRWMGGLVFVMIWMISGYLRYSDFDRSVIPELQQFSSSHTQQEYRLLVVLSETPVKKIRSYGAVANVVGLADSTGTRAVHSGFLLMMYFSPDSLVQGLLGGDSLLVLGNLRFNAPPSNPDAFDYGRYLRRKGIHGTLYVASGAWKALGRSQQAGVFAWAETVRHSIRKKIAESELSTSNQGLALALLIGIKDDLDPETSRSFAAAGAVHVLCVSGLHVGIVYMMISLLFGFLKHIKRYGRYLFFVCGICSIWGYALVTGLPPSVNRASLMFSFMMAGSIMKRKSPSVNAVLASAFVLLMDEPPVIFHPGFQLSYLAVIGIITMHPVVSQLWAPGWKLFIKMRDLISVSLCAQLFTFPVAVSMFSIFPNYFLLTNLLIIPITGLVVYAGVVFLVIPYAELAPTTTWVFNSLLSLMQLLVSFVDRIPGSLSENILLTKSTVWGLLAGIFGWMIFLRNEGKVWLYMSLMAMLLASVDTGYHIFRSKTHSEVVIYQIRKGMVADFVVHGSRFTVVGSDSIPEKDLTFAVSGWRLKNGVGSANALKDEIVLSDSSLLLIRHPGAKVLFMNALPDQSLGVINCTAVVIGPGLRPVDDVVKMVSAETWIIDERMSHWKKSAWKEILINHSLNGWDISKDGAWRLQNPGQ